MPNRLTLGAAFAALAIAAVPAKADFIAQATLFGSNEAIPNASPATGTAQFTYNSALSQLLYSLTFANLTAPATASHIHVGLPGVAGPIILPFTSLGPPSATSGSFSGTLTAANLLPSSANGINTFADAIAAIQAGRTYANIHSSAFPGGEIRGQIQVVPEPATAAGSLAALALIAAIVRRRRA